MTAKALQVFDIYAIDQELKLQEPRKKTEKIHAIMCLNEYDEMISPISDTMIDLFELVQRNFNNYFVLQSVSVKG